MTLRIVLIDDHRLFREGLRCLISTEPDLVLVAEGADARDVYPLIDSECPDVAIVDISLRGSSGITATQEIVRRRPDCKVLILTMHASDDYAAQAFAAGATGYALKDQGMLEFVEAIRAVGRGRRYLAPSLSPRVLDGDRTVHPLSALSPREREVFDLIVQRQSNRDVATYLCISIKTVETHRASINRKLGAHSTADLVRVAARNGLIGE